MTRTLLEDLNALHASYVDAVNAAVAEGDLPRAEELAAGYDTEAVQLVAEREGLTHLLPIRRPVQRESLLQRVVRHRATRHAA